MSARQEGIGVNDHPVLGQVVAGYSPMIDRQRSVVATRLTVFPEKPDAVPDVAALLGVLDEVWPGTAGSGDTLALDLTIRPLDPKAVQQRPSGARPPVALNIAGEAMLDAVMAASPGPQLMLEIPAFMAGDPAHASAIRALRDAGSVLLIKGRPLQPLAPDVLACFSHSIVDLADERRGVTPPPNQVRTVTTIQAGVRTSVEVEDSFKRGAVAVLGWTFDDPAPKPTGRSTVAPDVRVVLDLIAGVDNDEPLPKLEATLRRDPTIAYRLMRYLNSAAFGLTVEINSFAHALMLLGQQRLKRWLSLLLASSSKDANAKPTLYAAVRRGLLMEEIARAAGSADERTRSELFICGVFSLLDRLLGQPFGELLGSVPVPEGVRLALLDDSGPYAAYLELARAIEQASVFDIRERAESMLLSPRVVNRALLNTLRTARQLD